VNGDRPTGTGPGGAAHAPPGDSLPGASPTADAAWDAGELACGELLMELRGRLRALRPGGVLDLTALDPAAVIDIPAWCGLTGHALLTDRHPRYRIRRKED
jgi:tRNA 2-thiouridine synthesizing protein A